jgi:hypothetical protein
LKIEKGIGFDGGIAVCPLIRYIGYPVDDQGCYAVSNIGEHRIWEIRKQDYMSEIDYRISGLKKELRKLEDEKCAYV